MKKVLKSFLTGFLCFGLVISNLTSLAYAANYGTISQKTVDNVEKIEEYTSQVVSKNTDTFSSTTGGFSWDSEGKTYSWAYYNGFMMNAFMNMDRDAYEEYVQQYYSANLDGGDVVNRPTVMKLNQLDSIEPSIAVFDLLDSPKTTSTDLENYKNGIQALYTYLMGFTSYDKCGGNYWHKNNASWSTFTIALDGIYMAQPFLMKCANAIDEGLLTLTDSNGDPVSSSDIYTTVYNRLVWVYESMYNPDTKLYDHGYNTTEEVTNGITWLRGEGWYCMAVVDIIDMMPEGDYKSSLISELPQIFDGLLEYQDETTGMWYNVPEFGTSLENNRPETSGSAMVAYSLIKAYQNGYVTDSKYFDAGLQAFNGICDNEVSESDGYYTVGNIYKSSGASTVASSYCDVAKYVNDEGKGVAALIMTAALLKNSELAQPAVYTLSDTSYTYDGKVKTPELTVLDENGNVIPSSNYTLTMSTGRKNVGTYSYKIVFKGNYTGTQSVSFEIIPAKAELSSITANKNSLKVTAKTTAATLGGSGYQIAYRKVGDSEWTYKTTAGKSIRITNLTKGSNYEVQIRAYKKVKNTTYYGDWSSIVTSDAVK